jgi:hypothetical protein
LCREAVEKHGCDWKKIEGYVKERVGELSKKQQNELLASLSKIVRFEPPPPGGAALH